MNNKVPSAQDSFSAFYRKHYPMVYRVCFSYVKNEADALDMVQETFMHYLEADKKPEGEKHEICWLVMTAGNLCKNHLVSYTRSKREELKEGDVVSPNDTETFELLQAVLDLPDKYKTAVYLHYYEGFSTAEIAQITGIRETTVRTHLRRARAKLKAKLGG